MSIAWLKEALQIDGAVLDELKIVHDGEWEQDGKWQHKEVVVPLTGEENLDSEDWPIEATLEAGFYQINSTRSGSYYSDWEYNDDVVVKVEPYQETITRYAVVK